MITKNDYHNNDNNSNDNNNNKNDNNVFLIDHSFKKMLFNSNYQVPHMKDFFVRDWFFAMADLI